MRQSTSGFPSNEAPHGKQVGVAGRIGMHRIAVPNPLFKATMQTVHHQGFWAARRVPRGLVLDKPGCAQMLSLCIARRGGFQPQFRELQDKHAGILMVESKVDPHSSFLQCYMAVWKLADAEIGCASSLQPYLHRRAGTAGFSWTRDWNAAFGSCRRAVERQVAGKIRYARCRRW